jgi:hypothetical protein
VAGDRGGADVVPVDVLGRKLLGDTSLDGIDPAYTSIISQQRMSKGVTGGAHQEWAACPDASGSRHKP